MRENHPDQGDDENPGSIGKFLEKKYPGEYKALLRRVTRQLKAEESDRPQETGFYRRMRELEERVAVLEKKVEELEPLDEI